MTDTTLVPRSNTRPSSALRAPSPRMRGEGQHNKRRTHLGNASFSRGLACRSNSARVAGDRPDEGYPREPESVARYGLISITRRSHPAESRVLVISGRLRRLLEFGSFLRSLFT